MPVLLFAQVSFVRLVIAKYLSSFIRVKRYTRPLLPCCGSLGQYFPTFPVCLFSDYRYYDWLRLPFAHLRSLRSSLACGYLVPSLFFLRMLEMKVENIFQQQEFTCSPLWYPIDQILTRKQRILPSSCTTPVDTCPRQQTPVVSHILARAYMRLMLSRKCRLSAFSCKTTLSFQTTTIPYFGAQSYGLHPKITQL